MLADYTGLVERRQLESLKLTKRSGKAFSRVSAYLRQPPEHPQAAWIGGFHIPIC